MNHELKNPDKCVTFEASLFSTSVLAALIVVLSCAGSATGQVAETGEDDPIRCGPVRCLVPASDISHQNDVPFVLLNRIMDEQHPRWDQFRGPIRRHPDARSCLLDESLQGDMVDLLAVDWAKFDSSDSSVCFFRIFSTLSNGSTIVRWLDAVGMHHRGIVEWGGSTLARDDLPPHSLAIHAEWSREQYYEHRPTVLNSLFDWGSLTSWGPYVYLYSDGTFHSILVNSNSTWN